MAGNLFDVFVVGSADPTPAGENQLAAALSAKHGLPLATIAKAIATKNLRAGQSLDQAQAQNLVRQLQGMGAVTVIRPASGAPRATSQPSGAQAPARPPGPPRHPGTPPAARQPTTPPPAKGDRWAALAPPPAGPPAAPPAAPSPFGPPLGGAENMGAGPSARPGNPFSSGPAPGGHADPFGQRPPSGAHPDPFAPRPAGAARPDPFAPPPLPGGPLTTRPPTPPPRSAPGTPPDEFVAPDLVGGPRLELARADRHAVPEETPAPVRAPTGPGNLRDIGAGGASGVVMDEDPRNLDLVRCAQHGLYYDKTKASGCRKCLASAREVVSNFESRNTTLRLGNFGDQPAKRAFAGLGLAFLLGLLPAAYYAFGPGTSKARQLRIEQEVLSRQPGTEEILRRFDELDDLVNQSRDLALRNTAVVWAAVSAAAMAGWYKIT
jgi:hypothetical protein